MTDEPRKLWTEHEILQAIKLYCLIPFGKIDQRNPDIVKLAGQIGRTPSSVALKMANFAALDATLDRKGMANVSKLDREVWNRFFNNMDVYLENFDPAQSPRFEEQATPFLYDVEAVTERTAFSSQRLKQSFFRDMVLSSYDCRCAVTGIDNRELLVASHIIPWSSSPKTRLDPTNGICLSALFDRAFDRGLVSIDQNFRLIASSEIGELSKLHIEKYLDKNISKPSRFLPSEEYLSFHRERVFRP